jgi:adenylate kinase family enzyme
MNVILLLSGAIAAGKTAVTEELVKNHFFTSIGTGRYLASLQEQRNQDVSRAALQILGDELDCLTDYQWPVDVASTSIEKNPSLSYWLLDCVRKSRQVENFRQRFGTCVFHAHLIAPEEILRNRYEWRMSLGNDYSNSVPYSDAINHPNELASRSLVKLADIVVDTSQLTTAEIAISVLSSMKQRETQCGKSF